MTVSVSGKTIKCLGNQSEVAVNTGPFFDGKISVEGAPIDSDSRCSLYGNHSSSKEIYTMTINHVLCGSKVVVSEVSSIHVILFYFLTPHPFYVCLEEDHFT
jgi:hypothetical protein